MSRALGRLARNRPALAALMVLAVIALACLVGPLLTGHVPNRIYPDLVRLPPSLRPHPSPEAVAPAVERLAFRMRARVEAIRVEGSILHLTLSAPQPIDPRALTYLPRSDLFGPATIVARKAEGRRLVVEAPVRRLTFPLGTDVLGRDLLSRSLVAGRVSLLIGLVATGVALLVGVLYGAVAGYVGGGSTP